MFPLQGNELVIEDPSFFDQEKIFEDLLADCVALEGIDLTAEEATVKKKRRKTTNSSASGSQGNKDEGNNGDKKIMHREIERQRRQEMAGLYASLRSLLPVEYIKGKRSVSDHMHQAAHYIKNTQKNIEELKTKKDKLKKLCNPSSSNVDEDQNSNISDAYLCVNVNLCLNGLEILISSCLNEDTCFPLSKVLDDLIGRGHNVISCVSTRANEQSLHKIQIEANDLTCIDLSELQERLTNVIKHA